MADLDAFESSSNNISNDPVAEFLAREQSALGDLDDDLIVNKDGNLSATNENSPSYYFIIFFGILLIFYSF